MHGECRAGVVIPDEFREGNIAPSTSKTFAICGRLDAPTQTANAAFFRIGAIAHNLLVLFKHCALGADWLRHKVAAGAVDLFHSIRAMSFALVKSMSP